MGGWFPVAAGVLQASTAETCVLSSVLLLFAALVSWVRVFLVPQDSVPSAVVLLLGLTKLPAFESRPGESLAAVTFSAAGMESC